MEKEFIPYEQALALKELGFNRRTFAQYNTKQNNKWILTFDLSGEGQYPKDTPVCIAPTFSQAFRWFREKYANIEFSLPLKKQKDLGIFWGGFIRTENDNFGKSYGSNFKTYEEAELACLKKLIEILKQK